MANLGSACLDDAEYWRLRGDGFRNERECLGDMQNIIWKCLQDMQPFWDAAGVALQKGQRGTLSLPLWPASLPQFEKLRSAALRSEMMASKWVNGSTTWADLDLQ